MADRPESGRIFGIPYNFERPNLRRLIGSYWKPGERMIVEKPFGIGYTLNLANWRSWIVLAIVGVLVWQERSASMAEPEDADEEPVEVIIEDD